MAISGLELVGSILGSGVISSLATVFATRKKDSGDLATALVTSLMARIDKLEKEQAGERDDCAKRIASLERTIAQLTMKLEVLRSKAKVPSGEWAAIEAEFEAATAGG